MNLLIDWGNTRIKWLAVDDLSIESLSSSQHSLNSCESLEAMMPQIKGKYSSAYIASVRDEQDNQKLKAKLIDKCSDILFATTDATPSGVVNSYADPKTMGVDRWLGVIAASKPQQTVAIISLGSAITLDIVADGRHLGGHILPGRRLMLESLNTTGRVRPVLTEAISNEFNLGQTTNDCVNKGVNSLIEGYLRQAMEKSASQYNVSRFVFTGGGGQAWGEMMNQLGFVTEYRELLVFEGLLKRFAE